MTEQEIIHISTEDALLISGFIGREFPINVTWNDLMPVVEKIEQYRLAYPKQADFVCNCKVVIKIEYLYREVVSFINWYNQQSK